MRIIDKLIMFHKLDPTKVVILDSTDNTIKIQYDNKLYHLIGREMILIEDAVIIDEPVNEPVNEIETVKKENDKPRGWHFKKEFIDSEGNVYHKGVEQPHLKIKI
jgi:hypothetical protein